MLYFPATPQGSKRGLAKVVGGVGNIDSVDREDEGGTTTSHQEKKLIRRNQRKSISRWSPFWQTLNALQRSRSGVRWPSLLGHLRKERTSIVNVFQCFSEVRGPYITILIMQKIKYGVSMMITIVHIESPKVPDLKVQKFTSGLESPKVPYLRLKSSIDLLEVGIRRLELVGGEFS